MSTVLHMPSFSSSPYGLPEKNVESFAPAFTSVNGRSPTSPPTNEQRLPFPVVNANRTSVSRAPDHVYRSSTSSASPTSSEGDKSPTSPNKRRHSDSEEDSYVQISPIDATAGRYSSTQYQSGKLPSMENPQHRTLPPLDRLEAERRWATEPRDMPYNGYQELQPREPRPTEPQTTESRSTEPRSAVAQGPMGNVSELHDHEQTNVVDATRAGVQVEPKRRKRQFANRTKTGCGTCRRRKKKCDEAKPECNNCLRGAFECQGYASKIPWPKHGITKAPPPLQAKERSSAEIASVYARCPVCNQVHIPHCEAPRGSSQPTYQGDPHATNAHEGARSRPITVEEHERKPPAPSMWASNGWSEAPPPPRAPYPPEGPLPAQYPPVQPPVTREAHPPHEHQATSHHQQEPPRQHNHNQRVYHHTPQTMSQTVANTPAPAMVANTTTHHHQVPQHSRQPPPPQPSMAPPTTAPPAPPPTHYAPPPMVHKSEKEKMLAGQPFLPFDRQLVDERTHCTGAVYQFNSTANAAVSIAKDERARCFKTIVAARWIPPRTTERPVIGHLGGNVHVETPFHCHYGYNLSIAENVVIGSNCRFLDSARICIGRNTEIEGNVLISTLKTPTDTKALKGSNGTRVAQEVWIGENVYIGEGCIIEAGVKIGDGAIVRAGSVVVHDLPRDCIARGNPAFG